MTPINIHTPTLLEDFIKESIITSNDPLEHLISQCQYALTQAGKLTKGTKQTLQSLLTITKSNARIAIIGQFSSGKSTFLNALLGSKILPSGITPITAKICEICYGSEIELEVHFKNNTIRIMPINFLDEVDEIANAKIAYFKLFMPIEILKTLTFLDTPGFNSQNQSDTHTTNTILENVDGIIWLSLIDNVGKNSEKDILATHIQKYANKSLCVLNQKDRLKNQDEIATSIKYAKEVFSGFFSQIIAISSKQALESSLNHNKGEFVDSGMDSVLAFIQEYIIPNARKLKAFRIKRELKKLLINELYIIHKAQIHLQKLQSTLSLQNGRIKFGALQENMEQKFNALLDEWFLHRYAHLITDSTQITTLKKDYAICQLQGAKYLQNELALLRNVLILNYHNAIEFTLEKLAAKIDFALAKHHQNPEQFALLHPTLENIRDLLHQGFHFQLFQEKLLLIHSIYKKTFFTLETQLDNLSEKYNAILADKLEYLNAIKQTLKDSLANLKTTIDK